MKQDAANVIPKELAEQEVQSWLDFRQVRRSKRKKQKDSIEELVELIEDGVISLDSKTFEFKQTLLFSAAGKKEIIYKPTVTAGEIQRRLSGVDNMTGHKLVSSYVCELTGLNSGVVLEMNSEDYSTASIIAGFFY
jgi:hypothetical protein|tara:strand:+ start:2873 stop:3280 length:408 start_codon:yes stop_codon:yes gene_type:complete